MIFLFLRIPKGCIEHFHMEANPKCTGITSKDKPCQKSVGKGEKYCRYHDVPVSKKEPETKYFYYLNFEAKIYAGDRCIGTIRNHTYDLDFMLPGRLCNPKMVCDITDKKIELDFYDDFNVSKNYTGLLEGSLELQRFGRILEINTGNHTDSRYYRLFFCTRYDPDANVFTISKFDLSPREVCKCGAANYNRISYSLTDNKVTSCNICEGDSDSDDLDTLVV